MTSSTAHPKSETTTTKRSGPRGFMRLSTEKRRAISSAGGKAAHRNGTAHEFTRATAAEAGRLGGIASQAARRERSHAVRDLHREWSDALLEGGVGPHVSYERLVRVDVFVGAEEPGA